MSKSPLYKIELDRKKLYSMIGDHNYSSYPGKFGLTLQCIENGKGPTLSFEIYPFCYDQNTHLSVHTKVKLPSKFGNSRHVTMADFYHGNIRIEVTPHHLQGGRLADTTHVVIPLTSGNSEFKATIEKVLSHINIFYSKSDTITLHIEAFLTYWEKFEAIENRDDEFMFVNSVPYDATVWMMVREVTFSCEKMN